MKSVTDQVLNEESLGEIVAKDFRTAQIFKNYGLDFCCGGKKTLKEVCKAKGIDITTIENELQQASQTKSPNPIPFNEWPLDFLVDYILNTHHSYVKKNLPHIRAYAEKVMRVHGKHHPELIVVHKWVEFIAAELTAHTNQEETVLFPYIKGLVSENNKISSPDLSFGNVQTVIQLMENEHEEVGRSLAEIRTVTNNYSLPEDACATYTVLYKLLNEFENDLHVHVHLENNILFPKVVGILKLHLQ